MGEGKLCTQKIALIRTLSHRRIGYWMNSITLLCKGLLPRQFSVDRQQILVAFAAVAQVATFFVLSFFYLRPSAPKQSDEIVYVWFFVAVIPITFVAWVIASRLLPRHEVRGISALSYTILLAAAPTAVLAVGLVNIGRVVYYSYDKAPHLPPYSLLRFILGMGMSIALYISLTTFGQSSRGVAGDRPTVGRLVAWSISILLLLGLFDPYLMIDTLSYSPYVGPAFAAHNGSVPLIDTFSQYGPNFVLFTGMFWMSNTIYMASATVAILNVIIGIIFVYTATRLGSNYYFVLFGSVFLVLFWHMACLYNINYTPSVSSMRFFALVPIGGGIGFNRSRPDVDGRYSDCAAIVFAMVIRSIRFGLSDFCGLVGRPQHRRTPRMAVCCP